MGEVTATLKYGKGYEAAWLVFKGSVTVVKADIIEAVGFDPDMEKLTLAELTAEATKVVQSVSTVGSELGGRVIASKGTGSTSASESREADPEQDPWVAAKADAEAEASEPKRDPLFRRIEAASDVDALKVLYAKNKAAFEGNLELKAAWSVKGKSLKAEAAA